MTLCGMVAARERNGTFFLIVYDNLYANHNGVKCIQGCEFQSFRISGLYCRHGFLRYREDRCRPCPDTSNKFAR